MKCFFQTTVFDKDEFEDEDATVSTSVAEDINSEEDAQVIKLLYYIIYIKPNYKIK